jgi:hypothetical protein
MRNGCWPHAGWRRWRGSVALVAEEKDGPLLGEGDYLFVRLVENRQHAVRAAMRLQRHEIAGRQLEDAAAAEDRLGYERREWSDPSRAPSGDSPDAICPVYRILRGQDSRTKTCTLLLERLPLPLSIRQRLGCELRKPQNTAFQRTARRLRSFFRCVRFRVRTRPLTRAGHVAKAPRDAGNNAPHADHPEIPCQT